MRLSLLLALSLGSAACTVSKPRGDQHLTALAAADRHAGHGRLDEAEAAYAEAAETAERRVDRDEAAYRRARVLMRQERYDEAVVVLDGLAAKKPHSRRSARSLFDASRIRMDELGQQEAAMEGFETLLRTFPDSGNASRALFFRLSPFREADDSAGALALIETLYEELQGTPIADDLLRYQAELFLQEGQREEARASLERIVREHPYPQGGRWDDSLMALADMDLEDGNPEGAIAHLKVIVSVADTTTLLGSYTLPNFPKAQLRIAQIYRDELQDFHKADRAFTDLYDTFAMSTLRDDAQYERGAMWLDAGETRKGCRILRDLLDEFEGTHATRQAQARVTSDCPD